MKKLLQEYKKTLNETLEQLNYLESPASKNARKYSDFTIDQMQEDYKILKAAESDLRFAIGWIERGYKTNYRSIEKRDAYHVGSNSSEREKKYRTIHPMDHMLMDYLIEDKRSQQPFEMVVNEDFRTIEEQEECEKIQFEMSMSYDTERLYKAALKILLPIEKQILMLHLLCNSQEEIAEMIGVSQQAVSKRIKRIKKKLLEIGVERKDL